MNFTFTTADVFHNLSRLIAISALIAIDRLDDGMPPEGDNSDL